MMIIVKIDKTKQLYITLEKLGVLKYQKHIYFTTKMIYILLLYGLVTQVGMDRKERLEISCLNQICHSPKMD